MARIAGCPNVACKLSGLLTELNPGQPGAALAPAFLTLWAQFGPDRLLWGSDWPVVTLAASYGEWLAVAQSLVPAEHRGAVFADNARRIYRLGNL
jgi:L-fuconolactonase